MLDRPRDIPNLILLDILESHPQYDRWLYDKDALHHDPLTDKPVVTRIWASGEGQSAKGGWADLTSKAGRQWWHQGIEGLVDMGVDGIWKWVVPFTIVPTTALI